MGTAGQRGQSYLEACQGRKRCPLVPRRRIDREDDGTVPVSYPCTRVINGIIMGRKQGPFWIYYLLLKKI